MNNPFSGMCLRGLFGAIAPKNKEEQEKFNSTKANFFYHSKQLVVVYR